MSDEDPTLVECFQGILRELKLAREEAEIWHADLLSKLTHLIVSVSQPGGR